MAGGEAQVTRAEVEAFVYREMRLLDERRLEEWGALFTEDGIYWLPIGPGKDPGTEPVILCDDAVQRTVRIHQLIKYTHYSQDPPSRLLHFASNLEFERGAAEDEVRIGCNVLIHELRPGDFQELQIGLGQARTLAARCEYRVRINGAWRIAEKKVLLLDRDSPVSNLTCII
jgi:3-phenylpropionate/cinnamic acid dioxygenase small subunit